MIAFEKYKEIEVILEITERHKMWLEDYKGLNYSIAVDGKHLMKWKEEPQEYDKFDTAINCIGRKLNRCVIEFDDEENLAKENLELTYKRLKDLGYGFIRSTHKGKTDYLWVEFNRNMEDKEIEQFLFWIAPKGSKIDGNFASSKKVFPVLFAVHWKHSYQREMPIEFFEGNQINFDALNLEKTRVPKRTIEKEGFEYETIEKNYTEEEVNDAKQKLSNTYKEMINLLKKYVDTSEDNCKIIALWIIGTYVHKRFNTYPFLFINAMRGSGKTRLLKFIEALAKDGDILADLKEAVLFRTASEHTLIIDEFEHINNKDKGILRELLNAGYKQGIKVKRMKKVHKDGEEKQVVEEFEVYTPIVMANINGMDEVLNDRCLTLILEKSQDRGITRKVEDFDENPTFMCISKDLVQLCSVMCNKVSIGNIKSMWNAFVDTKSTTLNYIPTYTTPNYTELHKILFDKVWETNIDGRNFELMFPLFILADQLKVLDDIIRIGQEMVNSKKEDELTESKDVALIDFISHQTQWRMDWVFVRGITQEFRLYLGEQEQEDKWINERWIGKALKRLGLVLMKRRLSQGMEVILNIAKAQEKLKMFKPHDDKKEQTKTPN